MKWIWFNLYVISFAIKMSHSYKGKLSKIFVLMVSTCSIFGYTKYKAIVLDDKMFSDMCYSYGR